MSISSTNATEVSQIGNFFSQIRFYFVNKITIGRNFLLNRIAETKKKIYNKVLDFFQKLFKRKVLILHFNKKVIQRAMPIYIGYLFLGLACGILGQQAHIAPIEAFIMSILAYSGSGQFICIAMLLDHASLFSILITNFMVSLRYMFFPQPCILTSKTVLFPIPLYLPRM